jgi:hypothetical protein
MALQDAQRTKGLIRVHAAEYHIDPHKIGVLGSSAGGQSFLQNIRQRGFEVNVSFGTIFVGDRRKTNSPPQS